MRKFSHFYKNIVLFGSLLSLLFFSCSDDFVPSPAKNVDGDSEVDSGRYALSAPSNITVVMQGGKRSISLEWDTVSKAERYFVYAANSMFEDFEQVGETATNSFSYENLSAGVNKYLKVSSVDAAGKCSEMSRTVVGSTLAQPIISDIVAVSGKEDSSVTVHWYMENAEYYKDNLQYTITCKDSDGRTVASVGVDATEISGTSFTIDGLTPSETYVYTVEASLISNPAVKEESDAVDAETARRLRPNPPENLAATQGTELETVTVSFKLPEKVDVLVAAKQYNQLPLYFKISRRVAGAEKWTDIVSHLYYTGKTEKPESFEPYAAGDDVSWTDKNVQRGVQYEYKVQSYADDTTRVITSDLSALTAKGWAASRPAFSATKKLEKNDEGNAYALARVTFKAAWEMFGTDENWRFLLRETHSEDSDSLGAAEAEAKEVEFNSLEEFNSHECEYDLSSESEHGYYQYTLVIVAANSSADEPFIQVHSQNTFFFTDIIEQPKLETFAVEDGHTDKNVLSWLYESGWKYSLVRKTLDQSGNPVEGSEKSDFSFDFNFDDAPAAVDEEQSDDGAGEPPAADDDASFAHEFTYTDNDSIESGETYSYTLYATPSDGSSSSKFPSDALTAQTLGTPEPVFVESALSYDEITVSWTEVQKAVSYDVALYDGEKALEEYETLGAEQLQELTSGGEITYTIRKPSGYDDATVSGRPLTLRVKASSDVDSTRDGGEVSVRTLGPATTEVKASVAEFSDKITVSWNQVDGAAGYILQRTRYSISEVDAHEMQKPDVFYISSDKKITYGGEHDVKDNTMSLAAADGRMTLSDKQSEALDESLGFKVSQSMISWGVPFEYTVLPVLSEDDVSDIEDFKIKYDKVETLAEKGSAIGFGQNVRASKADYTDSVIVEWNKPYGADLIQPLVYYRNGSEWKKCDGQPNVGDESLKLTVTDTEFHEYSVNYGTAKLPESYTKMLADTKTELGEQKNVGYAFRMDDYNSNFEAVQPADKAYDFSETVRWTPYGTGADTRKVKPDHYKIYCNNTNYSKGWQEIAVLDADGKIKELKYSGGYDYNVEYEQPTATSLKLKLNPETATALYGGVTGGGSYEGLLKVLRDPRHYYKIVMTRENSENDEVSFELGGGMTKYTFRQITDAELARAAMGTLAYAFYIDDGGSTTEYNAAQYRYHGIRAIQGDSDKTLNAADNGGTGTATFSKGNYKWLEGKYDATYTLNSYAPKQLLTKNGDSATFMALSSNSSGFRLKGSDDYYLYTFTSTHIISVSSADAIPVDYSATVTFTCSDKNNLTLDVTRGGKTTEVCKTSNFDVRCYYFPMQIHSDEGYKLGSSQYGWWNE